MTSRVFQNHSKKFGKYYLPILTLTIVLTSFTMMTYATIVTVAVPNVMGAFGLPNIDEPLDTNVSIVISAGSTCSIFGAGSINKSWSLNELFIPKITITIVIDAIVAPMASDGACNNSLWFFNVHLAFCSIS